MKNNESHRMLDDLALQKKWRKELESSVAVKKYLSAYTETSTKDFLCIYVYKKSLWNKNQEAISCENENDKLRWINLAFSHLKIIQQKKLFDLQCLWRANNITLTGVEICEDFMVWQQHILNCPFIETITDNDVALYIQFLSTTNANPTPDMWLRWQNYAGIKQDFINDDGDTRMPEWYDFINGYNNQNTLLLLPDSRGEKEAYYRTLHGNDEGRKNADFALAPMGPKDIRRSINIFDEAEIDWFVKTFEHKDEYNIYKENRFWKRNNEKQDTLRRMTEILFDAEEAVPIEANENWQTAIEIALKKYQIKKIIEALPIALEQYNMHVEMGISFAEDEFVYSTEIRAKEMAAILSGRKLNGEAEDVNF